mmetsp:Transcript_2112/g.2791  ORF Transcript_2112/g.2791 Transcript_2112/m.2791 type:complete len:1009 (-) Transcript_2112:642-3668(-)
MATLLEGSSSLTNSAFVNQLASSSNPDDEKNFPREEYVNKLCELQKQQQERLEVHLPLQSVSELAEAYQVRITNWLCDEREKLIGHTVLVPGSFFPDSAQDEKNKLFKIQFTNYAPEQRWTGLNSKSRGHGAFFFIELNDRLLRAMPIALRGKGPCLPTYLATHGLDTDPPSETSNSNEPAFLRGTKKRKKKPATGEGSKGSIVHKYFRKLPDNDAVKVQFGKTHECLICAGIGDTTLDSRCFKNAGGNLSKHIRRKNENGCEQHQKAYNEIQSKNIMNVVDGQGGFIKKKSLFASFYENFSLFLFWLSQRLSLSAISNRHLKVGIASLNPQHRLFGDAYLKKLIHETARVLHGYIKNDLLETKARLGGRWLGLQVDLWTDANNVHYVCLGATWLDPQTCRRRFETLGSTAFPVPSVTASALKLWVKNTLLQFNLNFDDVILFTADGGEREMLLLLDCPWLICACHNMQRCVVTSIGLTKTSTSTTTNIFGASADDDEEEEESDVTAESNSFLRRVRAIHNFIKNSPKQSKILHDMQTAMSRPQKSPKVDCETRWWSTHSMLENFLELRHDLLQLSFSNATEYSQFKLVPQDFDTAAKFVAVLQPARDFVLILEGDKKTTLNKALPLLKKIEEEYRLAIFDVQSDPVDETGGNDNDEPGYVEMHVNQMGSFFPGVVRKIHDQIIARFSLVPPSDGSHRAQFSNHVPEILGLAIIADPFVSLSKFSEVESTVFIADENNNMIESKVLVIDFAWKQLVLLLQKQRDHCLAHDTVISQHIRAVESITDRRSSLSPEGKQNVKRKRRNIGDDSDDDDAPAAAPASRNSGALSSTDLPKAVAMELAFLKSHRMKKAVKLQDPTDGTNLILNYWHKYIDEVPLFYYVVCKILAGNASEANIERSFKVMRDLLDTRRSNLNVDVRDSLIFTSLNMKAMPHDQLADAVRRELHSEEYDEAVEVAARAAATVSTFINVGDVGGNAAKKQRLSVPSWMADRGDHQNLPFPVAEDDEDF